MHDNAHGCNGIKCKLKFWFSNAKKNWKLFICRLLLYMVPIILMYPEINNIFISNFFYVVILVSILFIANEYMNSDESRKNKIEQDKYKNTIKELKGKIESLENDCGDAKEYSEGLGLYLESLPPAFLKNVSLFLGLKNCDRISLYVLNGEEFRIIGRYSENPKFKRIGRKYYPSDCGYIAMCFNNNNGNPYFVKDGLPSSLDKYVARVSKETGMSADVIKALSMKSRSYFTRVITDGQDMNVGVLVIESTNKKLPICPEEMNSKLEELSIPHMSELLDVSNKIKGGSSDES